MGSLYDLIICEIKKCVTIRNVGAIIFLISCVMVIYSFAFDRIPISTWKESSMELRKYQVETIDKMNKLKTLSTDEEASLEYKQVTEICNNIVKKIDYCLENDIPYNPSNVWFFLSRIDKLGMGIVILAVVLSARVLGIENENFTWKNMFISGNSRTKLIFAKVIFSLLISIGIFLACAFIAFLVGFFRFGFNGNDILIINIINDKIASENMIINFIYFNFISIIKSIFYISLLMCIGAILDKDRISTVAIVCLVIGNNGIKDSVAQYRLSELLPFKYLAYTINDMKVVNNIVQFFTVLILFSILFYLISIYIYKTKDY
ncbi:ABC transporter permease subunit [Clostridium intestinale]|uniref:ABC-2 family transporter protein n=1 Tax=Clostridium intestinale DSM 6191 TaxID=1121320 RepID=A0A1M5YHN2_9CLOT|nr:ABC transporter permease subunit [Clostridium intestinale]SHI11551.1 hypothetical protein SAMN02745941_02009 [Clostridium intestinale DSM 6191]